MSNISVIDIYNLYNYIEYEYDKECKTLHISWNHTNRRINNLMIAERNPYEKMKYNCLWVEKLKECISWEMGNIIKIQIRSNYDGRFCVVVIDDEYRLPICIYEEINEDGYLYISPFTDKFSPVLEKCNCLYNDLLDEENQPYILK